MTNYYLDSRDVAARDKDVALMTGQKWYLPAQLSTRPYPNKVGQMNSEMNLVGTRTLRSTYSLVPLNIMIDNWIAKSKLTAKEGKLYIKKLNDVGSTVENQIRTDFNAEINLFLSEFPQGFIAEHDNPIARFSKFNALIDSFLERTYSPTDDELLYYFKSYLTRHFKFRIDNSISILIKSNIIVLNNPNQTFSYTLPTGLYRFDQAMADALNSNRRLLSNRVVEYIFLKMLRNKYLHWSADYGIDDKKRVMVGRRTLGHPMEPHFNTSGIRERPIITGK